MSNRIRKNVTDLLVVGIDSYFGIKYNLPPIATVASQQVPKIIAAIKEESTQEKLRRFFEQLKDVTEKQRLEFHKLLGNDKHKFLKDLMLVLDRLDEAGKAELIGKLYKQAVLKALEVATFRRLCRIVEKMYLEDIIFFLAILNDIGTTQLRDNKGKTRLNDLLRTDLRRSSEMAVSAILAAGLVSEKQLSTVNNSYPTYSLTLLGETFWKNSR